MKVLIYGAGMVGEQIYRNIKDEHEVVGFLDSNAEKKGRLVNGIKILGGVEALSGVDYDRIYIASTFWKEIKKALMEAGVDEDRMVVDIPEDVDSPVRNTFLECYAKLFAGTTLAAAEGGVFRGEFASKINRCFPDSKLYLFDTFEGFDSRDIEVEKENNYSNPEPGNFSNTSVELVMSKMQHPEKIEIHKGYFPETAAGVDDTFCFVNLDFDLYHPILEGLRFFYPKMVRGSVILVHDYYHAGLLGVKDAVSDFEKEFGKEIIKLPIGDNQSIALVKE
ncbi:MAG: class I SAM-dependent methyltransferase [Lachnospiraceae bacterium]|nr:class I SAM-dependent methyltransferase [Lachnospiraceae bacterium]